MPVAPARLGICWRTGIMRNIWQRRECEDYFLTTLYQLVMRYDEYVTQNGEIK